MGVVSIEVNDKKSVVVVFEDGRKVKFFYNHLLSENPDSKYDGAQMALNIKEEDLHGHRSNH